MTIKPTDKALNKLIECLVISFNFECERKRLQPHEQLNCIGNLISSMGAMAIAISNASDNPQTTKEVVNHLHDYLDRYDKFTHLFNIKEEKLTDS